jgi:hypothetical protein
MQTQWIIMLSLVKRMMVEYMTLLMNITTNFQGATKLEHLANFDMLSSLSCNLLLMELMVHSLIKFFKEMIILFVIFLM